MRVVCIDDEHLSLDYIERQLKRIDNVDIIGAFTNPLEGKEFILKHNLDVVFLDIEMTPINGLEIAEEILQERPEIIFVFVTAYESFAVDAFELNAMDYIVKPVKFNRLQITMHRIQKALEGMKKKKFRISNNLRVKIAPFLAFEVTPDIFEPLQWRTTKSQELFTYLLQNNGVIVEKSSIIDLLWDEYDMEKAYSLLYTTIYNIRKQLKPYNKHIVLNNHSYGYLLELHNVEIDLVCWEKELEKLPRINNTNHTEYEKVMQLYSGDYLSGYDYTWLEGERHRLERLWLSKANEIASFYTETNKWVDAIRWYSEIINSDPMIEEAHFNLMKIYEANGDFTFMMQQYNDLHKVWRDNFDKKPSKEIVEWYISKLK